MLDIFRRLTGNTTTEEGKAATDLRPIRSVLGLFSPKVTWTPRNHEKFAEEGYRNTVWVYACVQEITKAIRSIPPVLYREKAGGEVEEVTEHPLLDLMREPNRTSTWEDLAESLAAYTLTTGNRYMLGTNGAGRPVRPGTPPRRIYTLSPQLVKIDASRGDRFTYAIKYGTDEAKAEVFAPGEFWHGKTWNPLSEFYGMGAIEAAWRGVDYWNAAMGHNTALLQNGARPSGAWVTQELLTGEQFHRMKDQMTQYEGARNAGKQLLLEGGVSWEDHAVSPRDLDFLNGLADAVRQIHAAFGVHPVLTGAQEGTFENQEQALRKLYSGAAIPLLEAILSDLNAWLVPRYGDGLYLGIDKDRIEALSEDLDNLWKRTREAFTSGLLTREEARKALGYAEEADGTMYLDPGPDLAFASGGPDEAKAIPRSKILRDAQWKAHDERLSRAESRLQRAARKSFRKELDDVLDAISDASSADALETVAVEAVTGEMLGETMREAMLQIAIEGGRATRADLKGQAPDEIKDLAPEGAKEFEQIFGVRFPEVLEFIRGHAARLVTQVTSTTKAKIATLVEGGVAEGLGAYQIRDRIEGLYLEQIIPNRSEVIARTESIKAYNHGSSEAAKAANVKMSKVWIATRDSRTRDAHAMADDQRVALDERFDVDGELLEYPGDPAGSARNVIQCRCAVAYEVEE